MFNLNKLSIGGYPSNTGGSSGSNSNAYAITFNDSTAQLGASNLQSAVDTIDTKTDQIDDVNQNDYQSYINNLI